MTRTPLTVNILSGKGYAVIAEQGDLINGNSIVIRSPAMISFFALLGGTVTIKNPRYDQGDAGDGLKIPDRVLLLPPATTRLWLCPLGYYEQPDSMIYIDFAQPTSVAVYALQG